MFHYLFTNDLRITKIDKVLPEAGYLIQNDKVPSYLEDKNLNNNVNTLSFYFNLYKDNNCCYAAKDGNIRKVVLNFIKKFQFPNTRTEASYRDAINDGIILAPMRVVLQLLYTMQLVNPEKAFLSRKEILEYVFLNENIAKNSNPNIVDLAKTIIENRDESFNDDIPKDDKVRENNNIYWNHCRRQIREIIKILLWSGCVSESENELIRIHHDKLTDEEKSELFDILTYNKFWNPQGLTEFRDIELSYRQYMDISKYNHSPKEKEKNNVDDVGKNILIYGVPGCGKSHYIKQNYCSDENYMERIVFHPDYSYSDFIGQILPVSKDDEISYPFTPGPFTRIMKKAVNDKDKNKYYLVIEEINRGNAPAIFGEVFQLLDRNEKGESDYGINNADIAKEVYGDEKHSVKIPENLFILATMNTADQNVFTLDTAFKRRWRLKSIKNDIDHAVHANESICNTKVVWGEFAKKINDKIIELGEGNLSSEDNRLGAYFLKPEDLHDEETFAEKVLMYLWNDAFKFNKADVFKPQYRTLEDLIEGFKLVKFEVFSDDFNFDSTLVETDLQDVTVDEYLADKEKNMVSLYGQLLKLVKDEIHDVIAYSVPSKAYIGLSVPNMKRSNFVDLDLKKDKIVISCEKPNDPSLETLVENKSDKGSYNHFCRYYLISDKDLSEAVSIIVESYNVIIAGE